MTVETSAMRLADLNPRDVGRDAARRLVDHLSAVAMRLGPAVTVEVYAPRHRENALPAHGAVTDEVLDSTDLALSASALCEFAQRGGHVWDWEGAEDAADAAHELVDVLSPDLLGCEEASLSAVLLGHAESADDALRLVLTAVWARVQIARGEAVTAAQLGALVGLHPSRVRALRGAGEIPGWTGEGSGRGATPCPARVARQWLAARGVAGM